MSCDDVCDGDRDCMDTCKKDAKIKTQKSGYYGRRGIDAATVVWVVVIGLAIVGSGVNLGYSYFTNVIPTKNARDYLHIAMEYNDFEPIKEKLQQARDILDKYSGNANWFPWATVDTSFDEAKAILDSNIATCDVWIGTPKGTNYTDALYNFISISLPATAERLGWIIDYMLWRPLVVLIEVICVAPLAAAIIIAFIKDQY